MTTEPYFETNFGKAFLGDSLELMKEIPDASINLVVTSPPFALTRKKAYGNKEDHEYIESFMPFADEIKRILTDDGSFVLDLGGARPVWWLWFDRRSSGKFDSLLDDNGNQ